MRAPSQRAIATPHLARDARGRHHASTWHEARPAQRQMLELGCPAVSLGREAIPSRGAARVEWRSFLGEEERDDELLVRSSVRQSAERINSTPSRAATRLIASSTPPPWTLRFRQGVSPRDKIEAGYRRAVQPYFGPLRVIKGDH